MLEPHETLIGEMPAIDKPDWISRILLCAVGFSVLMGILAATRPHPLRVKLDATEVENAGLLSRNQELNTENKELNIENAVLKGKAK